MSKFARLLTSLILSAVLIAGLTLGAVAADKVTVRLSGWVSSPAEEELLKSLIAGFTEKTGIEVKYEPIPDDYMTKIKSMLVAKNAPDVFYLDVYEAPGIMNRDLLYPLNDLMAKHGVKAEEFLSTLIQGFSRGGKIYGIPKDFNTLALFYNKDLFDAAKVPYPTADWTWEDLENAAKKLTNVQAGVYGFCTPADPGRFPVFVFQNGGNVVNEDATKCLLDEPPAIQALEFYTGLLAKKIAAKPQDLGNQWQGTLFGQGKVAMVYEGGWLNTYLKNEFPKVNYGVAPLPKGPKGAANLYFTVAYVIPKTSKNPEAAFKLIQHLTSVEAQTKVLEAGFAIPTRVALQNHPAIRNNPKVAPIFDGYAYARPFQWGEKGFTVNELMGKMIERVILDNAKPADAAKEFAAKITAELRK